MEPVLRSCVQICVWWVNISVLFIHRAISIAWVHSGGQECPSHSSLPVSSAACIFFIIFAIITFIIGSTITIVILSSSSALPSTSPLWWWTSTPSSPSSSPSLYSWFGSFFNPHRVQKRPFSFHFTWQTPISLPNPALWLNCKYCTLCHLYNTNHRLWQNSVCTVQCNVHWPSSLLY